MAQENKIILVGRGPSFIQSVLPHHIEQDLELVEEARSSPFSRVTQKQEAHSSGMWCARKEWMKRACGLSYECYSAWLVKLFLLSILASGGTWGSLRWTNSYSWSKKIRAHQRGAERSLITCTWHFLILQQEEGGAWFICMCKASVAWKPRWAQSIKGIPKGMLCSTSCCAGSPSLVNSDFL